MAIESSRLARASLWIALAGFAVPVTILFVGEAFAPPEHALERACLWLFVLAELAALACGFSARDKPLGKAGLIVSVFLLLGILGTLLVHLHMR